MQELHIDELFALRPAYCCSLIESFSGQNCSHHYHLGPPGAVAASKLHV